jgi:uncharacterized membrane protein YqjE
MIDDIRREVEVTVAPLLRNILDDAQKLFRQEWALAKVEVREDARRARDAVAVLIFGLAVGLLAFLFLSLMAVYLVAESFALQIWASYGIVAGSLILIAGVSAAWGMRRLRAIRYFPEVPFHSLKEDVEWLQRTM